MTFLCVPTGRWKGRLISDLPRHDLGYARWLLATNWFRKKYFIEARALTRAIERYEVERQTAWQTWQAELEEQHRRDREAWLAACKVNYVKRGVMPFGKFRGQLLSAVVRAERYYRWLRGSPYFRANPELATDLEHAAACVNKRKIAVETEIIEGCCIYRPACFQAKKQPQKSQARQDRLGAFLGASASGRGSGMREVKAAEVYGDGS